MRSNYRRIGDFIELVDERNKDLEIDRLLGLSITKEFIPSVANTVGTNMKNYKIIRKNQFACSIMQVRRDKKIPVAILKDYDEAIISQAYPVFRVADETKLLPDYLMMWMSREEFDREACFLAVGGVRGSLEWEDFLDMELPVPSIEKQREIVTEYNTVVDRIELNEQINQKLEETAKAIYRQWFEEFEFPISKEYAESIGKPELEGQPYKSSGGEMVYNEELDKEIPKIWTAQKLDDIVTSKYGYTASASEDEVGPKFLRITDISGGYVDWDQVPYCQINDNDFDKYKLKMGDVVIARTGASVGSAKFITDNIPESVFASYLVRLEPIKKELRYYVGLTVLSDNYYRYIVNASGGSAQPQANATIMRDYNVVLPKNSTLKSFESICDSIFFKKTNLSIEIGCVRRLSRLQLSKLARQLD